MPGLSWRYMVATVGLIACAQIAAHAQSIISISLQQNGLKAAPKKASAGKIVLKVTNNSDALARDILILPMNEEGTGLLMQANHDGDHDYSIHALGKIT